MTTKPAARPGMIQRGHGAIINVASLAGLKSGEVICIPSLDDPTVLTQIWESERKLLERSGGGDVARRYAS